MKTRDLIRRFNELLASGEINLDSEVSFGYYRRPITVMRVYKRPESIAQKLQGIKNEPKINLL
jgi:hypothetical protein